ncbi:MAG: family 20 glycosylhydrolase [Flavobacteriaceae bacterium]|nr:family 20 glycosylhydrolase [Flavobacteriaceae bacterium]MDG2276008.1 family 20 glycosylhydrolase [Flavobacteriaceae bacterium]
MKHSNYLLFLIISLFFSCKQETIQLKEIGIIPKPLFQEINKGVFVLDEDIRFISDTELNEVSDYFKLYLEQNYQVSFTPQKESKKIVFSSNDSISNEEGYELKIEENSILIASKNSKGAFYAVQSLLQLMPIKSNGLAIAIPCLELQDKPQFKYRGMHLDVGRHFFSVDFIKKYIDLMARLKMNTFHWHLTEDQGWRIEIKKYPKLQEIAAFRNETLVGHYNNQPHQFDGKKYGGFYTQEQIKEVVAYANTRQVTIIPEIEMPGHSQAAIAAYPALGCTGEQVEVATKWGIFNEVYCPKESTFKFLENVIDEVVALFPGKYIHIGGDEAPKTNWKKCAHCQKLIKKEGLKDEHGLQSYFIARMEKYINTKGKQIIGWDEILEGGLAPNATVMSWRGTSGAIEAAKEGHDVILTPGSHCYFDHYQSENENEPLAIGGFLPLEKVYHFNPIPEELTEEESKYVLGAQGNVWTEYMKTEKQVEYMAFPRAVALSEVVWSSPENKNYSDFINRLEQYQKRLDQLDVNYANHMYSVKGELKNTEGNVTYQLNATSSSYPIYYATDESAPSKLYVNPIPVDSSMTIKAVILDSNAIALGAIFQQKINLHKGVGAKILIDKKPHPAYNAGGKNALINGISGNNKRYGDKEWLGFSGEDIEITIKFENPTNINSITTRFFNGNGQWIYAPKRVTLYVNDDDSAHSAEVSVTDDLTAKFAVKFKNTMVTSIRLKIPSFGIIPEGKQGAGHKPWTFIDEIIIE